MHDADLLVVGGGFAGLSCARAAAVRGMRTLVIDSKTDPGAAPHTTGILVKEVADAWDVPRALTRKIRGVRLYSPALRSIDLVSPGYYFLATDTPALLRWLGRQAQEAGATVNCALTFVGREPSDNLGRHRCLIRGRGQASPFGVVSDYIAGCDGARSRIAREFNLGINRDFLVGVEAEYENLGGVDEDWLHVFIDSRLAPGYIAWVVPGMGITQVGLAVRQPAIPRLDAFVDKLHGLFDFSSATVASHRGGLIPCGGTVSPLSRRRVMLIGDAAGMVSPLTAGGIHTALELGRAAGIAISNHLLDDGPDPAIRIRDRTPSFHFKRLLRAACDLLPPNQLYDLLLGNPAFCAAAQSIFFHHRGLLCVDAWKDIFWDGRRARVQTGS